MKQNEEASELAQLNARVPAGMKRIVKAIAVATDLNLEDMTADAFRLYLGVECQAVKSRRKAVLQTFKKLTEGEPLPFEAPLIPNNCNATFASRGESDFLDPDNGIVGVADSSSADSTILERKERVGHGSAVIGQHGPVVALADRDRSADGVPFSRSVGFKLKTIAIVG